MPSVLRINSNDEFDKLRENGNVFFVDFYADWCGPCKMISPVFDSLAKQAPEGAEFYKLNIDDVPDVAQELNIRSIPAFHVYKGKERLGVFVGANRAKLTRLVETHLTQ